MRNHFSLGIALLCAIVLSQTASAQSDRNSVVYPAPAEPWSVLSSAGMTLTILPRPIAEEEIRQIPMVDLGLRVAVPYGGSLLAGVSSNYLTTNASVGLQWSYAYSKYAVAIGDRHAFWYGTAQIEGFDASAVGWMNMPFVAIGADFKEVRLSLRGEIVYILQRSSRVGENEIGADDNLNAGSIFTLALEQPFIDSTDVTAGVRLYITDAAPQSWLAFSTFRDKLVFPEIFFAVTL